MERLRNHRQHPRQPRTLKIKKEAVLSNEPLRFGKTKVGNNSKDAMTAEKVIQIVCEVCGITIDDLRIRSRREPLPTARALIAHYLYRELKMFPREICVLIGHPGFGRTSVNFYLPTRNRKATLVQERSRVDRNLAEQLCEIDRRLKTLP